MFPLQIAIEAPYMQEAEAKHLVHLIQHALDDSNDFSAHHLRLRLAQSIKPLRRVNASLEIGDYTSGTMDDILPRRGSISETDDALSIYMNQDDKAMPPSATLGSQSSVLEISYSANQVPSTSSSSSTLASFVASQLSEVFEEEEAIIEHILSNAHLGTPAGVTAAPHSQSPPGASRDLKVRSNRNLRPELANRLTSRSTRSLKYSPRYHITISLFTPSSNPSSWQIQDAISEYLDPLLDPISRISNFSVDTQIQLHAAFSPTVQSPVYDEQRSVWTLREEDLSAFINAAEWPLSPSIGDGPTLNFILYVPDPSNTPLVVKPSYATSWLIPQWGGVVILNPMTTSNTTAFPSELSKEVLRPALLTFSHQLLSFLGAPSSPQSLPLQFRSLTRIQAASLLLSSSSTMGSLAQLTKILPTIAIPETVSAAVETTLDHLRKTCSALKDGRFGDALESARIAEAQAEKGFFEKSMVGQVYFPDEHKVAVYLPLLGPVGVPLIMSAIKELKRLLHARKSRQPTR